MKKRGIILALLALIAMPLMAGDGSETAPSMQAKVVWETAEPTCPLTKGRLTDEIDDPNLYPFELDGDVTEPVLISNIHDNEWTETSKGDGDE